MKKIYSLFLISIATIGYGQLSENFDASTSLPSGWTAFRGLDGNGVTYDWIVTVPPANVGPTNENAKGRYFSAPNCAFVRYEVGGLNEDWLVTPIVDLTNYTSPSLTFYAGQQYGPDYLTNYFVKISTTSQTDISTFVDAASYVEADFTGTGNSPTSNLTAQKTVDLSSYTGQQIYIAFVMVQNDGDNWSLDNVAVTGTLSNIDFESEVSNVYPNPTTGFVTIQHNQPIESIKVIGLLGTVVKSFSNTNTIDLSDLNTGTYLVNIIAENGETTTKKIVKK